MARWIAAAAFAAAAAACPTGAAHRASPVADAVAGRRTPSTGIVGLATAGSVCAGLEAGPSLRIGASRFPCRRSARASDARCWRIPDHLCSGRSMPRLRVGSTPRDSWLTLRRRRVGRKHRGHTAVVRRILRRPRRTSYPTPLLAVGELRGRAASTGCDGGFAIRYFSRLRAAGAQLDSCTACRRAARRHIGQMRASRPARGSRFSWHRRLLRCGP